MNCMDIRKSKVNLPILKRIYINTVEPKRASLLLLLFSLLLLAACVPITEDEDIPASPSAPTVEEEQKVFPPGIVLLTDGSGIAAVRVEGNADAEEDTEQAATLTINRPTVNIRSGPSTDSEIVAKAAEGDTFSTSGRSEEGWWRICCVDRDDAYVDSAQTAWISQTVVTPDEAAQALPALQPLFPEDLSASWNVQYECGSRRCAVAECAAVSRTVIRNKRDLRWLEINRIVTWEEACRGRFHVAAPNRPSGGNRAISQ